jgi:4a-hydroxytetrahydrobiopterin dehydratase
MTRPAKLSKSDISAELEKLPAWQYLDGKLQRQYAFADFVAAFGFMTSAALVAEKLNHHPDWSNAWNLVRVELMTHDAKGVTSLDVRLAHSMEQLAQRFPTKT